MKLAACVLIVVGDKVLAVNRPDSTTEFCLPGGKLEHNEQFRTAAARELQEETGIVIYEHELEFIFKDHDDEYFTVTYLLDDPYLDPEQEFKGDVGIARFVDWEVVESGPFAEYNKELHKIYKEYHGGS